MWVRCLPSQRVDSRHHHWYHARHSPPPHRTVLSDGLGLDMCCTPARRSLQPELSLLPFCLPHLCECARNAACGSRGSRCDTCPCALARPIHSQRALALAPWLLIVVVLADRSALEECQLSTGSHSIHQTLYRLCQTRSIGWIMFSESGRTCIRLSHRRLLLAVWVHTQ